MPAERLRMLYIQERIAASSLPDIFAVSQAALLNRLAGFLKAPTDITTPSSVLPGQQKPPSSVTQKRYGEIQQAAIEAPTPALIAAGPRSGTNRPLIWARASMV